MGEFYGFLLNSILLGVGLAMDAFSVSVANGLHEPGMSRRRQCAIAGVYAVFQAVMPMSGWLLVRTAAERFRWFQGLIPWIGGGLLVWIGGRMLLEGLRPPEDDAPPPELGVWELLVQGVATSIDALSVGFAIAAYRAVRALAASGIIAGVTFCLCMAGLILGGRAGAALSRRAPAAGGLILIGIGLEMLARGLG